MPQVSGRAVITANGKRYATREGATLKYSEKSRQAEQADTGTVGFSEKTETPEVQCTIVHTPDVSLKEIDDIKDATISFDCDNGKSFVLSNAWSADPLSLSKGDIPARFQGLKCEEI